MGALQATKTAFYKFHKPPEFCTKYINIFYYFFLYKRCSFTRCIHNIDKESFLIWHSIKSPINGDWVKVRSAENEGNINKVSIVFVPVTQLCFVIGGGATLNDTTPIRIEIFKHERQVICLKNFVIRSL